MSIKAIYANFTALFKAPAAITIKPYASARFSAELYQAEADSIYGPQKQYDSSQKLTMKLAVENFKTNVRRAHQKMRNARHHKEIVTELARLAKEEAEQATPA